MGQPKQNPMEHINVITTRCGKQVYGPIEEIKKVEKIELTPPEKEVVEEVENEEPHVDPPLYKPPIPFPQRFAQENMET